MTASGKRSSTSQSSSSPTGAILLNDSGTELIYDDKLLTHRRASVEVVEGNSGTVTAFVTTSLSNPYDQAVTVNYFTYDYSAVAGIDYLPVSGTLTFVPGGPLTQQVAIAVVGDRLFEATRLWHSDFKLRQQQRNCWKPTALSTFGTTNRSSSSVRTFATITEKETPVPPTKFSR